jgi:ricin-type beta-trefoil lectin protein
MTKIGIAMIVIVASVVPGCALDPTHQDKDDVSNSDPADPTTSETESALAGIFRWKDVATSRCIDSSSNGDVFTLSCNDLGLQHWTSSAGNFGDQVRDNATGRCLDSNTAGKVYTLPCNGGAFQQWKVRFIGIIDSSGYYEFRNVATGLCLDSNAKGNVYTLGCNGGQFQHWIPLNG